MNWLSPLTAISAAAITVPLLMLLYFLKLKRQNNVVPSTLLWKRAVQDLQVNAPFQRLRRNILLLLQILMLLAILAALGGPVLSLLSNNTERYVILLDNSASMNATDVAPSRLDSAKEQARVFIESVTEKTSFSLKSKRIQIMVVSVNDNAKVVCNFSSDKKQLLDSIDNVSAGDGGTNLEQALTLARAYCQSPDPESNNRSTETAAKLILFSDGGIRDLQNLKVAEDEMVYQSIGTSLDNTAITAMKARRSFENAERVDVFATLTNYNEEPIETTLELSINGDLKAVKAVTVPPKGLDALTKAEKFGQVAVDFDIASMGSGIVELRQTRKDHLAADDVARAVIAEPQDMKVLLVSDGNPVLLSALKACEHISLFTSTPAEFAAIDPTRLELTRPYDIVVLDNHDGSQVAMGNYLVFGKPPEKTGVKLDGEIENQFIVDYRQRHPVLNYVNLDNLFVGKCYAMDMPRDADIIAEFEGTPALGVVKRNNSTYVLASFDVMQSNWPFEPGFVLFIYNTISYLADNAGLSETANLTVGEPLVLQNITPGTETQFNGPGFEDHKVIAAEDGKLRLPAMERVGAYELKFSDTESKVFVVNLMDKYESNIAPKETLELAGREVKASKSAMTRFNQPIWPYIVMAVLLLACIEWFVYNSKIRI